MGVIVVVCAVFGLTVSEAKTKITCLRAKGVLESTAIFSVEASGPGVQPDERDCIPRGERQPQCRPVHRGRPAHTQRTVQLPEVHPRTVRPAERSPRAQNPDAIRAEVLETMLYGCVTWSPRACHYTTRCAEPTTDSWLAASVGESTIAPTTRFPVWTRLLSRRREVRASRRIYAGGGSYLRDFLWRAWRIRDCRSA